MDTINQVAIESNEPNYWTTQRDALERLEKNDDFKTVILDGYFKDKAVMGTSILASDQVKASNRRTDVMEGLIAVSALRDHFNVIKSMGDVVESDYEDYDDDEDADVVEV